MRSTTPAPITTQVVMIGSASVGKTSITSRLARQEFLADVRPTVGVGSVQISYEEEHRTKTFLIWDTAGQELYRSLAPTYFRNTAAAICVFDVTQPRTLEDAAGWIRAYRDVAGEAQPVLLIANKIDASARSVHADAAREFAASNACAYLEVSAKDATGVDAIVAELRRIVGCAKGVNQALDDLGALRAKCCS
jgi:small GTP-binding protein